MSLVNDMLRDLDQRRQGPGEGSVTAEITPAIQQPVRNRISPGLFWGGMILTLLLITAAAVYFLAPGWVNKQLSQAPPSSVAKQQPVRAPTQALDSAELSDSTAPDASGIAEATAPEVLPVPRSEETESLVIGELNWQRLGSGYRLTVDASAEPVYSVRNRGPRQLRLLFEDARLGEPMPALPEQLLEAASLSPDERGLLLALDTDGDVRFQVFAISREGSHQLIVELQPLVAKPTAVVQADQSQTVVVGSSAHAGSGGGLAVSVVSGSSNKPEPATEKPGASKSGPAVPADREAERPVRPLVKTTRQLTPEQQDQQQAAKARSLIRKGRETEATELLSDYLSKQPRAPLSRQLLASLLVSAQQLKKASLVIEEGLKQDPEHIGLRKIKARIQLQNGKPTAAIALLERAAPPSADDPEFYQLRAAAMQRAGQHASASRVYYQLLQQDSTRPSWWAGLAISLEALGRSEQARQAYQNVLQIPGVTPTLVKFVRQRIRGLSR